ncbi:MAG TPA: carbonic anhydrase [Candidatus Kapabacteria bacterium]|nr:carbonic anhydrase [Candidatus Kapabacteria bacterium]
MLNYLKEGNQRFVNNEPRPKDYEDERFQLTQSQSPYVVMVTCSDSRTPAELIFDESLGKFFVIRTAGNVLDKIELGSIEYAVQLLNTPLILIMGHTKCGAVNAALSNNQNTSPNIQAIIDKIEPAISDIKASGNDFNKIWAESIKENILYQIEYAKNNSKIINDLVQSGSLQIVGGIYNIETGKVDFIENI